MDMKGVFGGLLVCLALCCGQCVAKETLHQDIARIIEGKRARVGVAVIIDGKDTVTVNNEERYPMMSVFKFHQALAVADFVDRNDIPLSARLSVAAGQLRPDTYSPLRDRYPDGGVSLPLSELLTYTLQLSDNNACDILFDYIGGVQVADNYIRSLGIDDFAISATEADMHRDPDLCDANWTTPLSAACLLETFLTRPLFNDTLRKFVENTMVTCRTGGNRLAKPLEDTDAVIGHKTGTGDRNPEGALVGTNDIGFVFLPDGRRYVVAVFVKDSEETSETTERIIADVSSVVYQYVCR